MPIKWNVEAALEEIIDAIDEGAVKLGMDEITEKSVKNLYRKDFESRSEAEWRASRSTLLDLARLAGSSAEMATIVLWVNGIGKVGEYMDCDTVLLVCVMVSRLHCPLTKGTFCQNSDYTEPMGKKLDEILKDIG